MPEALPSCPTCHSDAVVKNGRTRHSKQNYKCRECGRQFVLDPQWRAVSEEHRALVDRLLLEKIPLAAIARAMQVSEQWLQSYVNALICNRTSGGAGEPKAEAPINGAA